MLPASLGSWRLGTPLGQGRAGEVWRCRRDDDPREYALKVIPAAEPTARRRVEREIEGLRQLDHPSLPRVRDSGATGDALWLVMDLAEGRPLTALGGLPGLDARHLLGIGRQLAEALAHAHARGVHHRDVKPANAVIDPAGHVTLVDFGVAALDGATQLTADGRRPGTPAYAPPEWFVPGPIDGAAADVYALGVILHELATGAPAFDPPGDPVARRAPLEPSSGDEVVRAIVRAATSPDPRARPSAAAIAETLAAFPAIAPPFVETAAGAMGPATLVDPGGPAAPHIGRYRVEGELGRGGMGVVVRAHDTVLDRPVAIKRLFTTHEGARARFAREARNVARLDHPGIIRVLDSGSDDLGPYFVMELVDGPDLATVLGRGVLDRDRALEISIALGEALEVAHAAGIVHRDVKPANVLLEGGVHPRLGDFGVAALADETRLTRAGGIVGTPSYMAPEQAAGRDVDARADVYALGAVLLEMLTGDPPPPAGGAPAPLPEVPGPLGAVVRRALEPDRADRHPSMGALVEDLRRVRDGRPVAGPGPGAALARSWRRPATRVAAAIAAAAMIAVGVPAGSAAMRAWDAAARERAAGARRVSMDAEIARLLDAGDVAGADRAFDAFAAFPEHQGTEALGLAWQDQARRLDRRPGAAGAAELAWAQAWATAEGEKAQAAALLGLGDALIRDGRHASLGHLVVIAGGAAPELDGIRRTWARWRRAPLGDEGADALAALLVTGTRPAFAATARPAAIDDDGDGRAELYVPTRSGVMRLPGGRWLDAPEPTGIGRTGDLLGAVVPGVGPVLVAAGPDVADPKSVLLVGARGSHREVHRWVDGAPVSALGVDLDRDGTGELLLATDWPVRKVLALAPAEGAWRARVLRPESATNSAVDGLLLHPDGGALVATFGAFGGFDVRRLDLDGAGGVSLGSRRKVGATGGLAGLRGPGGARLWAIGTALGPPLPFPRGVPELGNGLHVLDDAFEVRGSATSPAHGCERPLAADLDGDGLDEVVGFCRESAVVADVGPDGVLEPAWLGGVEPLIAGDADGDGDDEVVAVVAGRQGDHRPWTETWVLGAGRTPLPRFEAPAVRGVPAGVDAALASWWERAEDLAGMGLHESAEARLEILASLDPEGATGTSALLRAAEIADVRGDGNAAADRRSRAAARTSAGPEVLLEAADAAAGRHAFAEATSLLERWRRRAGPGADDGGRAHRWAPGRDAPVLDLDVGGPLHAGWRVERPLVLTRDAGAGELRVRSVGPGVVARLPVRVMGPLVEISVELRADRLEVGSGIALHLSREDGRRLLGAVVVVHGGGGAATPAGRATVGVREAVAAGWYDDVPRAAPLPFDIDMSWYAPEGRVAARVTTAGGTQTRTRAIEDRVEGDLWLDLSAGEVPGAAADVAIRRISLRGLAIRDVGPVDALARARGELADGDARAVLEAHLPELPEARVLRAVALDDLGRQDEADAALVAAAGATPDADLGRLFAPLLLEGPTRLAGAARRGLGSRWAPLFAATFEALGHYHPEGERFVSVFTRTLGDLSGATDPATASSLETLRARAWRQAGRLDLAEDAARRAVELARRVAPAPVPDHATTPLSDALYELALLEAPRDAALAVGLLRDAVHAAEAREILADRICADPAFASLRATEGFAAIDAARRSSYPATQ